MAALFLLQTLVGAASQHYRAELAELLRHRSGAAASLTTSRAPGTSSSRSSGSRPRSSPPGIFLAPMIAGREPRAAALARLRAARRARGRRRRQPDRRARRHPRLADDVWAWFGNQGFEYLDLGRFWQMLLSIGLFFWVAILFRGLRGRLRAGAHRQHALALLLRRAGDPGLLRRGPARAPDRQLHHHRLLALLGGAPLGRGLPRAVHDHHGRLHLRAARRGARARRADGRSTSTSCSTRPAG